MIKAGIIGTGNIGTDLLLKLIKTDFIEPIIFAGRRMDSNGIKLAQEKGIKIPKNKDRIEKIKKYVYHNIKNLKKC